MNRREASKLETRQLILSAAKKLFLEKGVGQCTMRGIAKEAGVSAASVVVHFKNKTALLELALYEDIDRTVARAIASLPSEADLLDRLMHISKAMYSFYNTNRELYRALIRNTVFEPVGNNPHLARQLEQYLQFLALMIEDEKAQGKVRTDVNADVAAASFASLHIGVLIRFYQNPEMTPQLASDMLAEMTQQYLTGIMATRKEK
jgi:AcrR family transcriptional regulator